MLVLVVGPSGAGKDSLLDGARAALAADPRFRFVRRVITRPASAGGEAHEEATDAEFQARRAAGGFALDWQAHGLRYGIPSDIVADLAAGRVVVANVSRGVIETARARFPTRVIVVTAPADILAARLAARGREGASAITERLARDVAMPTGPDVETVMNDRSLQAGIAAFLAVLNRAAESAPRS
jgi:ribose 1,5-bisphosphokinase